MPYERVTLAPRYALRLDHLQAADAIEIECPGCRRRALVAPHRLHDRFAAFERLTQICRRMRCRRCGSAGGMTWHVVRASAPGAETAASQSAMR